VKTNKYIFFCDLLFLVVVAAIYNMRSMKLTNELNETFINIYSDSNFLFFVISFVCVSLIYLYLYLCFVVVQMLQGFLQEYPKYSKLPFYITG
jgi:hypothetical protein